MACWSAEKAIKAYLRTLEMGNTAKEPDVDIAEFISALAAGNNAQLMVVACASAADSTALALVAAAHQTGGRVICILRGLEQLRLSKDALGHNASHVEFVIGEAKNLLLNEYLEADFVLIDCNLRNHDDVLRALHVAKKPNGSIVLGYNAFGSKSWRWSGLKAQLLPIGGGLLVTRIDANAKPDGGSCGSGKSHWVVRVDYCTGEDHVFWVRSPRGKAV